MNMNINTNSILFRTLFILFISSSFFVSFISISSKHTFSDGYITLINEKIDEIISNISPQIALNLSYGFNKAIDEIGDNLLKDNPNVLFLEIKVDEYQKPFIYSKDTNTLQKLKVDNNFISTSPLIDSVTLTKIGTITIVYSNKPYKKFMKDFYIWFSSGISIFIILMLILAYYLYSSLKNLTLLDSSLKKFNPAHPEELSFNLNSKDEVASISKSAKLMIHNIINFLEDEKRLQTELSKNKKHLEDAQRLANVGSWEYDINNKILSLSDEIYRILGLKFKKNITYQEIFNFINEKEYVINILKNAMKKGSKFDLQCSLTINNKNIIIHTIGKVRKTAKGSSKIIAASMDITQEEKNKKTIHKLAFYDSLTELPNRSLLKDRIHKALQYAKRQNSKVAILFLDLDHFKLINDTLGHSIGDKLLIYTSKLLRKQLRESDTLSRIGGDEFIILLPDIDSIDDAKDVAKKILTALNGQHNIESHQLYISTSIGISIYPDNSIEMDGLIKNADTAMYEAKQNGRNNYKIYFENMGNYISKQLTIEHDLREAIETDIGLQMYYQPKIDVKTNRISGAEALIRWIHPTKGMIFPDEFIHVAESTGIILKLSNWIIEDSIKQVVKFNEVGLKDLKIAINLSARQFQDQNLLPFISSLIEKYKVNPKQLEFEITETVSMKNLDNTLKILERFKSLGVSIAIDDFGTGHSSLLYLKKFPINTLKIDQSFVFDMVKDEGDRVIVQTIISMAHSLGFRTVAEGVETLEHVELLKTLGCDEFQGYYYSKPIPADKFIDFSQNYNPNT